MKRLSMTLLGIAAVAWVCGCAANPDENRAEAGPTTMVRCRVFEVGPGDAGSIVPAEGRRPVAKSPYEVAVIPLTALEELQRLTREDSGLLEEHASVINQWPRVADGWAYTRADEKVQGGGSGAGFLGVRGTRESREFRAEYNVTHHVNRAGPIDTAARIQAPIFFKGNVGEDQAVVFVAPFTRTDGQRLTHVVAFNVDAAK